MIVHYARGVNQRPRSDRRRYAIKTQGGITPLKAQLLGFLAGDGCIAKRRGRGINTDPGLLRWFAGAIQQVYGVTPSRTTSTKNRKAPLTELFLCAGIVEDLHSLASWGIHCWTVPQCVVKGSRTIHAAYVRGFFDAEGSVFISVGRGSPGKHHSHVAATSANETGLRGVAELLNRLGISHGFYPFEVKGSTYYKLQIHKRSAVKRYAALVGFESARKREALERIHELPPVPQKGDRYRERMTKIKELGLERKPAPVVAGALGCSTKQVWDARRWAREKKK